MKYPTDIKFIHALIDGLVERDFFGELVVRFKGGTPTSIRQETSLPLPSFKERDSKWAQNDGVTKNVKETHNV